MTKEVHCEHCFMTFRVGNVERDCGGVERTQCEHQRHGKRCKRPFWHGTSTRPPRTRVGIEPHRLAEWQQ